MGHLADDLGARIEVLVHPLIAERAYAVPLYSLPVYYVAAKDLEFKAYADEMPRFWEMTWN